MKKAILLMLFVAHLCHAQSTWYIAAKGGLNLREKPTPTSKVIELVPYGKKVTVKYPENYVGYSAESFDGFWWEAQYNGKKGYLFSEFIFPVPPPDANHKYLQDYIKSFPIACGPIRVSDGRNTDDLGDLIIEKYMTTNGIQYYSTAANEYGSFVCIPPAFNIYKAFHLIRLFPVVATALGNNDDFPTSDRTVAINELETFSIKLTKSNLWVTAIELRWEGDGYPTQISIIPLGGEIAIVYESGAV